MVKYVKGNLLDSGCDCICHQVNCQGRMRSGIAKQIRERWPEVYIDYINHYEEYTWNKRNLLGTTCITATHDTIKYVISMFCQDDYGYDGARYTSYDAFATALYDIARCVPGGYSIGFPKNIGCGLGGGNWKVISALIEEILGEDFDVYIYEKE